MPSRTNLHRPRPDAGRVLLSILSQIPPLELRRYTLLAAQRVDDNDLADDLLHLSGDATDTERRLMESVSMFMTYSDLQP